MPNNDDDAIASTVIAFTLAHLLPVCIATGVTVINHDFARACKSLQDDLNHEQLDVDVCYMVVLIGCVIGLAHLPVCPSVLYWLLTRNRRAWKDQQW